MPGAWTRRLSLGALGLSLTLLVAAAWGSGFFYLAARLGAGSPIRLALVDGVHVYTGLAAAAFFGAKVLRVGLRTRVSGVPRLLLWQRWISYSLLILYSAIFVTGVAALLPIGPRGRSLAVNAHLLTSVWAVVPTSWHIWHYRARIAPLINRLSPRAARYWPALAVMLLPLLVVFVAPRALSALPQAGGGGAWSAAGLSGVSLERLLPTGDGRLLAGGDGLYLTSGDGRWRQIELPNGLDESGQRQVEFGIKPASPPVLQGSPPAHDHAFLPGTAGAVQALATHRARSAYYVGTQSGVFVSPWPEGPYIALPFPGGEIHDLVIDPANPYTLWATSDRGPYISVDGGHTWTAYSAGLRSPATARSLAYLEGSVYLASEAGLYRFDPGAQTWLPASSRPGLTSPLAGGGRLHQHGSQGQVAYAGPDAGLAYGPAARARDLVRFDQRLWAAGDGGIYSLPLETAPAAGAVWWIGLLLATAVCALIAVRMIRPASNPVSAVGRKFRPET